jgi:hypothetical protein
MSKICENWRRASRYLLFLVAFPGFAAFADEGDRASAPELQIKVLSSPAFAVTGDAMLAEIRVPSWVPLHLVRVMLNGEDVTSSFKAADAFALEGVVTGLRLGSNLLTASVPSRGDSQARLVVTNYPITGPVFSGPHQTPFVCETTFLGLGAPLDADCSAPSRIDYFYRSTQSNSFQPFDPSAPPPADLATTTTNEGVTVPYIVRREMGTINRAVYVIAILHDPAVPLSTPFARTSGYNGRLVYSFGGGCQAGYHQGRTVGGLTVASHNLEDGQVGYQDYFLSKGYAVIGGSLNATATTCADVISAETAMMIKARFIEEYGAPRYTIGAGGSGGSMQQHLLGNNYPGLIDGIMPGRAFPDNMTFLMPLFDCELLVNAINTSALPWSAAQKTAVSGYNDFGYCTNNGARYPNLRAKNCNATSIPPNLVYDPITNPTGARCTYQDNLVNVFGTDPQNGFARRPFDNVGVQYGLGALNAGEISFAQFVDLNARIGGQDINGNIVSSRMIGDPEALSIAYRTGRVNEFGAGDAVIPIIDIRSYLDFIQPNDVVDVHTSYFSGVNRARLIATNGTAANQVIVTVPSLGTLTADIGSRTSPLATVSRHLFDSMDRWLANIKADHSRGSMVETVLRNKPADLVDSCYDAQLQKITDAGQCAELYPYHSDPRLVAGAPSTDDVFKCQLKPVDPEDYSAALTADQVSALRTVFPDGVCDYKRTGIGQAPLEGTWLSYPTPGFSTRLGRDRNED